MKHSKRRKQELLSAYLKEQGDTPVGERTGVVIEEGTIVQRECADNEKPKGNLVAYFDGACEPRNPGGNMGIGATIRNNGKELFRHSTFVKASPTNSNNVAEYMAFEAILDFIILQKWENISITVYGDSNLVIQQIFGTWKIKRGGFYVPYYLRCLEKVQLIRSDKKVRINGIWIKRDQNKYADELSKAELINHNVEFKIQPLSLDHSK